MLKFISSEKLIFLVKKIKEKKDYAGIPDKMIEEEIEKFFNTNHKIAKDICESKNIEKSSAFEKLKKDIRSKLRYYSGMFKTNDLHMSVKERQAHYKKIYETIFEHTGVPKSVLDLGCGLNPLFFPQKSATYFAADMDENILSRVEKYFKKNNIKGDVFFCDLRKISDNLPKADICLLFKVLDIIESSGHKVAEKIIKAVPCKNIVVSFPTTTLSGKKMSTSRRPWLEKMLKRLKLEYLKFKTENEVFYIIKKY